VTLTFLILVLYGGRDPAMTTLPQPYHYEECKARGEDFVSVDRINRRYFCIVAPDK
jgi:hypothetical protein